MLPDYLKKNIGKSWDDLHKMKSKLRESELHTVCESARCPNICECFSKGSATFMILGDKCTRSCGFCATGLSSFPERPAPSTSSSTVKCGTQPDPNVECETQSDPNEPKRVAQMAKKLNLKQVVVTSVTRDDLEDGGAQVFADTVREIRRLSMKAEVLVPDFKGNPDAIRTVVRSKPDVYGHNLETVSRLYPLVRKGADYYKSLSHLAFVKELDENALTKSAIMLGLGEKEDEVIETINDLKKAYVDILFIGHYLRPTRENLEVSNYVEPEMFEKYKKKGYELGFKYVQSGPFVRSSYLAAEVFETLQKERENHGPQSST